MPEWQIQKGDTLVDVRGSQTRFRSGLQTLSARGHGPFLLGVTAPFLLSTTSVARASAVGLEELERLEVLEELGN